MAITIDSTSELTSVDASSSVAGSLVTLVTRAQTVENASATSWPVCVKLTGVNGLTPTVRVNTTQPYFSGYVWAAAERGYWSPDVAGSPSGVWDTGIAAVAGTGYYDCQPPAPLSGNVWWFSRSRRIGAVETLAKITALASTYGAMVKKMPGKSTYVLDTFAAQTNELGGTVAAQPFYGLVIDDPALPSASRRNCYATTGVHAGEDLGNSHFWAFIEWWCGASSEAIALRTRFNLNLFPLWDSPGRNGGHCRAQFQLGAGNINDLNRHMADVVSPFETVGIARTNILAYVTNSGPCPFTIDFHSGYSTSSGAQWGYGNQVGIAPLNNPFMAYWTARSGAGNAGNLLVSDTQFTDAWSAHNLGALLAETLESNQADYAFQTDAAIATHGADIGLSLHDLLAAGYFGSISATATPFGRRAA